MDQEKKEQKEKEKKEQEIRKKFKLTGPIQVLHQARACVDSKGGKNELTVKQGDQIEIIRLTDNPEGKWLGRIKGCYGYIKTTVVEIDYDSLKTKQQAVVKQPEIDQEVYDDVGEQDSISSQSGGRNGAGSKFLCVLLGEFASVNCLPSDPILCSFQIMQYNVVITHDHAMH